MYKQTNKEEDLKSLNDANPLQGKFADDQSMQAKEGADLVQLAEDSAEQETVQRQEIANKPTEYAAPSGNGGNDEPSGEVNQLMANLQQSEETQSGSSFNVAQLEGDEDMTSDTEPESSETSDQVMTENAEDYGECEMEEEMLYHFVYEGQSYVYTPEMYEAFVNTKISDLSREEILQMRLSVGSTRSIWNHFKEINDDQYIVSWIIETTRGVDLPAESFISNAEAAFSSVESALATRDLTQITQSIKTAEPIINNAIDTMTNYRDSMIDGAGNWIRGLEVTSTTSFAIAAVAGGAVLGPVMVGYAGGSTVLGGVYTGSIMGGSTALVSSSAKELGETIAGTQDDKWLSDILYNTVKGVATGAATSLLMTKLAGPYLTKYSSSLAKKILPSIAPQFATEIVEAELAALIHQMMKGSANRFFMTCVQQTWDEIVYAIAGGQAPPSMEEFVDKLILTTAAGGLVPIILASGPAVATLGTPIAGIVAGSVNEDEE